MSLVRIEYNCILLKSLKIGKKREVKGKDEGKRDKE
jgi:hypothetical protein